MNVLQSIKDHATNHPDIPFSISEVAFLLGYIKALEEQVKDLEIQAHTLKEFNKGATLMAKVLIQEAMGDQ
jgi:hypothetical protein